MWIVVHFAYGSDLIHEAGVRMAAGSHTADKACTASRITGKELQLKERTDIYEL